MSDKNEKTTTSWTTYALYGVAGVGAVAFLQWLFTPQPVIHLDGATITTTISMHFPDTTVTSTHSGVPSTEALVSGMKIAPIAGVLGTTIVPESTLTR